MTGTLYLCATPIGNLEDITFRVLRTLKEVDLIAAEDTRNSIKLLNHFEIKTPMTSYHEFNEIDKAYQLVAKLKKAGLVKSIRGAGGGYVLAKPMEEISVGDVLRALEGDLKPVECAGLEPGMSCSASDVCVTKYVWQRINESISRTVDEIYLDQLVE